MSYFVEHPKARWAVPAVAVVAIAGTSFAINRTASADSGLPHRSVAQLLSDVQHANLQSLSGTVVQTADLGLPQLPGLSGAGDSTDLSLTSLASGSHTWRVWLAGPTQQRLALVGNLGESDVIRNGSDVWLWSSRDKTAVHHTLSSTDKTGTKAPTPLPSTGIPGMAHTPSDAAQQALAVLGKATSVTTSGTAVVAGRPAYELVLAPKAKDSGSRIAQVRIAIDAQEHLPLRVQVYSTKLSNPAFEVGFTAIDFAKPDARQFAFNPPPGTKVTQSTSLLGPLSGMKSKTNPAPTHSAASAPKVVGSGWDTVVVATVPELTGGASSTGSGSAAQLDRILSAMPKASGTWGTGHVIDGTLLSAVLTDDGRVAIGALAPEALYAALGAK